MTPSGDDAVRALGASVARSLGRRPDLWPTALRVGLRLAPGGWWRRWPPRPWPDPAYTHFRLVTMYGSGGGDASVTGPDVVRYLEWCRRAPGRPR